MKNILRIGMLLCMFLLGSVGWTMAQGSLNDNVYVSISGNDDNDGTSDQYAVQTLAKALTLVAENGTIQLAAGTYNETSALTISKAVTIKGAGKDATIISGQTITVDATNGAEVKFEGVKLAPEKDNDNYAVVVSSNAKVELKDCSVSSCHTGVRLTGVAAELSLNNTNIDCTHYAIGVRNLRQKVSVSGGTLTGWAAIMTSAGSLDGGSTDNAQTTITVNSATLQGRTSTTSAGDGWYGVVVLQQNFNGVELSISNSKLEVIDNTSVSLHEYALKKMNALDIRSYGNTINVTNSELSAQYAENGFHSAVIALGLRPGETPAYANGSTQTQNKITLTSCEFSKKQEEYLVFSNRTGEDKSHDELTINGVTYSPAAGNICYTAPTTAENLQEKINNAVAGEKIVLAAGEYELSSQLTINKAITLEGTFTTSDSTRIIRTSNWSGTDNNSKHMICVQANDVELKNIIVDAKGFSSGAAVEGSGIQVYNATGVKLTNVVARNTKAAGVIVNSSTVTATNLHTEGNIWGGVNTDQKTTGVPSFTFDEESDFDEPWQVWSEATNDISVVHAPDGWRSYFTTKGNENFNVWTDNKLTTEVFSGFPNKSDWTGTYTFIYANGNPILITQGEQTESSETVKISVVNSNGASLGEDEEEYVIVPVSANPVIIGGSKNATVASSTIYMESGTISMLFGGGYGETNGNGSDQTAISAGVTGLTKITMTGGTIKNSLFGGGIYYNHSKDVQINLSGNTSVGGTSNWVICGGFESGQTYGPTYPDYEYADNTVESATLTIDGGTYGYIAIGGTDGAKGYIQSSIANISNATIKGGVFGNGSNGRSDNVTAHLTNCTFTGNSLELAAVNRGIAKHIEMTFDQCAFPSSTEGSIYANIGATWKWGYTYNGSDAKIEGVPGDVSFTFTGCTNTPVVGISDGLADANVSLTGATARLAKFEYNAGQYRSDFQINAEKTWTFNNGLTFATDENTATLTNNGTLIVKGVDSEADLQALVNNKANEITTTLQASEVPAAFSGMTELPKKMVIYAAGKAVYMTKDEADVAAAMSGKPTAYLIKKDGNTYTLSAEVSAPTTPPVIEGANKPSIVGEPEAGKTLSAYALTGGTAMAGNVQVAGSFTWADPDAILAAGENEYDVVFTPVDLTLYSTVKTRIKINAVQYYTVTVGTCENGKVIIENASTANKYKDGTTLNLRAEADAHYKLKNWGEGITDTNNNTITYTVEADKKLTATFEAITHEVTVSSVTGGSLSVLNNGTTISSPVSVPEGTILTVVATPSTNKELDALTYQIGSTTYPIRNGQVEVSAAMTISATFKDKANYLLKVEATNGKILLFDEQGNAINMGTAVATGTKIAAVAVPDKGYKLSGIEVVGGATRPGSYFQVNSSDVTFRPTFDRVPYSISTEGTVTLTKVSGSGTATTSCHYGDVYTATATASAGKKISLLVNGKEMANGGKFTVTGDMKIKVNEVELATIQIDETKQTYVYDGEAKKFAIRSVPMGLTGFTVTYKDESTTYTEAPTNAGTYNVIINRAEDGSFAAFNQTIEGGLVIKQAELKGINAPTWDATSNKWTGSSLGTWAEVTESNENIVQVKFTPYDTNFKEIVFEGIKNPSGLTTVQMPTSGLRSSTLRATPSLSINATNGAVSLWNGTQKITSGSTVYVGQTLTVKGLPNAGYSSNATWTINNVTAPTGTSTTIKLGSGENTITVQFPDKVIPSLPSASNTTTAYSGSVILPTITNSTGLNGWTYVIKAGGVVVDHPTDADTYEVYASRSEDEQYKAVVNQSIGSYTISKKTITGVTITSASPILKGQTLAQSTLTGTAPVAGTFAWASPTTVATGTTEDATESQEYAVIFTPNDTKNYEVGSSVDLKQNVTFYSGSAAAAARVITFDPAANGTFVVKVNGVAVETGAQVSAGDQVVVETTPNSGYSASVSYTGITNGVVNASGDVAVTVTFTQNSAPVTPGGGGTVDPEPEIPTVSNPVVAERTATTAAITWEKVSGATSYKLFLYAKKTDSTPLKTYEFDKDGKLKATTISFTLTGLEEGKSYYIETAAYNALGTLLVKKSVELSATPTGIEAISEGSQLYTVKGAIVVAPAEPLRVAIYSVTGQTLFNDEVSYLTQVPAQAGIYVVVIQKGKERTTEKVFVK